MEAARDVFLRNLDTPFPAEVRRFRTSEEGMGILGNPQNQFTLRVHVTVMKIIVKMQAFEHKWEFDHLDQSSPLYQKKVVELRDREIELDQSYIARDRERAQNAGNTDRWMSGVAFAVAIATAPI